MGQAVPAMAEEGKELQLMQRATLNRIGSGHPDLKELKELLDSRNNDKIIEFLEFTPGLDRFEFAVLRLTINNDHNTLKDVLDWGREKGLEVRWDDDVEEKKSCKGGKNPVMIASLQGYQLCTKILYDYGYRIPQVRCHKVNSFRVSDVDQELVRQSKILEEPGEGDQVEKFMTFKAYSRPHYLSLLFKEDADLTNLKKVDPLRRALDLAEGAEVFSYGLKAISELKKDYWDIKNNLELFTTGLLTQCSDMGEIITILKHDPEDDDDDEIDEDGQNWQKALWEGRKAFVSHPFYQQFFWKQLTGSFNPKNTGVRGLQRHLGSQHISAWYWHALYIPYAILLFCCYPVVVVADLFRKADILFVTPDTIEQRKADQGVLITSDTENMTKKNKKKSPSDSIFAFFRSTIHVPLFRMHVYHTIQFFYLALLLLSIWNPNSILDSENQTKPSEKRSANSNDTDSTKLDKPENMEQNILGQWYMVLLVIFTVCYLIEDIIDCLTRKKHYFKSFWNPYSLVTHTLLFTGGALNIFYFTFDAPEVVTTWERANLSGSHYVNVGMTFVAFAVGMEFFRTLRVLLLFEFLGPIVICMINTFIDAIRVFVIYFVIFAAQAVCTWCLYKPFQDAERHNRQTGEYPGKYTLSEDSLKSKQGLFDAMIWRMLGPEGPERVHIKRYNESTDYDFECKNVTAGTFLCTNKDEDRFSLEFSHLMGVAVWAIYQIIVVILLLNILIAIMNNTYARVWQSADKEWKFGKTYYQAQFLAPRAVFPAPFRFIYTIAKWIYQHKLKSQAMKANVEQKEAYYTLLKRLLALKQQAEYENTDEDNLKDLRTDLLFDLGKQMKKITMVKRNEETTTNQLREMIEQLQAQLDEREKLE